MNPHLQPNDEVPAGTPPDHRRRIRRPGRRIRRLQARHVAALLRIEAVGGALLVAAAALAVAMANSPLQHWYTSLREVRLGPAALGLDLTVQQWAADGLLALFFFLAGLELKREITVGELRNPRRAVVPVAAAVGGMVVPAAIYLAINGADPAARSGWAIPSATDIAFALAVLGVVGRHLPAALRTFLLTLAVVDDLLAIVVIAVAYTRALDPAMLVVSLAVVAVFAVIVQRGGARWARWWTLAPLAVLAWGLMHASGVHATVAGVLMGFAIPVLGRRRPSTDGRGHRRGPAPGLAERLDRRLRPFSAGLAVPIFAFLSAGVAFGGLSGLGDALSDRTSVGIVAGLVVGKTVGILGVGLATARIARSPILREVTLSDLLGLSVLGGVGFTVSLLIGELAFPPGSPHLEHVPVAVLAGSLLAALISGVLLALRDRRYRRTAVR